MSEDTTRIGGDVDALDVPVVQADGSVLVGSKLSDLINLIGSLLKNGLITDVTNIISLISDPKTTVPQLVQAFVDLFKKIFPQGPTPPKAFAIATYERKRHHTKEEVEEMIKAEGGDPAKFAPWILIALQFLPFAIDIIRKLLGK